MMYQKYLQPLLKQYNAALVAISPMLVDGTADLATKRNLEFSVCSDFGNALAKKFRITFTVQPHTRPFMEKWGDNLPEFNGVDSWEIPIPATYVIAQDGRIVWSFLDNDPGIRAEVQEVIHQVALLTNDTTNYNEGLQSSCGSDTSLQEEHQAKVFNRSRGITFRSQSLKKLWKSVTDGKVSADNLQLNHGSTHSSGRSEKLAVESVKRTRRIRGRSRSATEFLGKYMLPG